MYDPTGHIITGDLNIIKKNICTVCDVANQSAEISLSLTSINWKYNFSTFILGYIYRAETKHKMCVY
jgi:hypothetical protein